MPTPVAPTTGLASQSGHWYQADGSPAYEIPAKKGGMRAVTLRDARTLNLYPSVTTIMACAAKPALETWKVRQGILSALTLPRRATETLDDFAERVLIDSREQARQAAVLGTLLHEQIERAFAGPPEPDWWPFVAPVLQWLKINVGPVDWRPERSFASSAGYGGKVDLFAREPAVVVDFKTKDFDETKAPEIRGYDEQGMQLAAYAAGLGLDTGGPPRRINLFVSTRVPGLLVPHEWPAETYGRHLAMFNALLSYWKCDKGYDPCQVQA